MQFYSGEIGHGQHFRQQSANVIEMSENALGAFVRFAAENFVAVNAEAVEEILCLVRRFPWRAVARGCFAKVARQTAGT